MTDARAAVALFLYRRLDHARRIVAALRANDFAADTDVHVFCDGARDETDRSDVEAVREFAHSIDGFKSVRVEMAEANRGISRSIIAGVSKVFARHERAVIVEDDVVLSPRALTYFNAMLDHFSGSAQVSSISGFAYPQHLVPLPRRFGYDIYFTPRLNCWGWATWRDRWQAVDWDPRDAEAWMAAPGREAAFARGGGDMPGLWQLQRTGRIDSWAIRWDFDQFRRGLVTVHPRHSYAINIGLDGSGVHGIMQDEPADRPVLATVANWRIPPRVTLDRRILWAHKDRADRLMPSGRLRRLVSLPAWWVRIARARNMRSNQSRSPLSESLLAAANRVARTVASAPTRVPGTLEVRRRTIAYADLHSFYHQARQIFGDGLYDCSHQTATPVILDCGAHIGLASIYFKDRHPGARIRAYEADPGIARMCSDNLAAFDFSDVAVTAAAVWSHDRGIAFDLSADDAGHVVDHGSRVASVRLRDELERGPVDLLKLDIEGAEFEVIADCGAALRAVRRMIVEVHVFGDGDDRVGTLLSQIEAQGFRYVLGDLHHATWKESDPTPFGAVTTGKYYFTVFAWRPA